MDTFDTSEEVMSEIDIEETEVDFSENFEHGVNDQERENNNEQEAGIDGEKGEKSIEDEKLEEKEETLSQFISANRGGSEEFKLEYEGTFVLSTLNEEQKSAQADLLTSLTANPEQSMMLPDHVEGKTTYFTAARMDNEGNLKYEIRSFTNKEEEKEEKPIDKIDEVKVEEATLNLELSIDIDKQEEVDKETLIDQSLLAEIEVNNEQEIENVEEIVQSEEGTLVVSESSQIDVEPMIVQEEGIINNVVSHEQFSNIDTILNGEQVVVENVTEEKAEEKTLENVEKVLTLEDRIRELLRDENEPIDVVSEQIQTSETENAQQEPIIIEQVIVNTEDVINQTEIHEIRQISQAESIQEQTTEQVEQIFATDRIEAHKTEEVAIVNEQESKVSSTVEQISVKEFINNAEAKSAEQTTVEQTHPEKTNNVVSENNKDEENIITRVGEETLNVGTIPINVTDIKSQTIKIETIVGNTERNNTTKEIKAEEEVVEKVQSSDVVVETVASRVQYISKTETILSEVIVNNTETQVLEKAETVLGVAHSDKIETQNVLNINIENNREEKTDQNKESPVVIKSEEKIVIETKGREINLKTEKTDNAKSENIITERRIQDRKEKAEKVILNNDKDIKITNTRESKVVTKEATPEKVQVLNTKPEKEAEDNVLPFKTRESRSNSKDVEIKAIKLVVEKTNREAIVLKFNNNTANNTARNETPRSLEKLREEKRTTEESLKAKPLNSHKILLQILGISQDTTESRNAEPTNSRSVPNINQEEQETKSTKSIPSIYQPRNLNEITLKIAV
jgi:hypothetical protein